MPLHEKCKDIIDMWTNNAAVSFSELKKNTSLLLVELFRTYKTVKTITAIHAALPQDKREVFSIVFMSSVFHMLENRNKPSSYVLRRGHLVESIINSLGSVFELGSDSEMEEEIE